jgi:hypothetical protein
MYLLLRLRASLLLIYLVFRVYVTFFTWLLYSRKAGQSNKSPNSTAVTTREAIGSPYDLLSLAEFRPEPDRTFGCPMGKYNSDTSNLVSHQAVVSPRL